MGGLFLFLFLICEASALRQLTVSVDGKPLAELAVPSLAVVLLRPLPSLGKVEVGGATCQKKSASHRVLVLSGTADRLVGCEMKEGAEEGMRAVWRETDVRVEGLIREESEVGLAIPRRKKEEEKRAEELRAAEPSFMVRYWWVFAGLPLLLLFIR